MNQALHQRGLWSLDELTAPQAQTLLATARAIKQAKGHGQPRLYDAIECDGMDPAFMLELASSAAVPVSNVLLQERHPTRMLADLMTMQEVSAGPVGALTVCVIGDERSPWSVAWRQVAAVCGVVVLAGAPGERAAPVVRPIVFVCDPQRSRCTDGQPALLAVGGDNPRGASLARRQVANHRFVVQALLSHSIG